MRRRTWFLIAALGGILTLAPALAGTPESLSILINGYAFSGKALWYKGKIYVPLEEVAKSTGGTFGYDPATGEAVVTVGAPPAELRAATPASGARPYIKVTWERKYLSGNNARVMATLTNQGDAPARDLEAICIFKDGYLNEIGAVARPLGTLGPGQSRTVEFQLYQESSLVYPSYAYTGGYYYYPGGGLIGGSGDKILVNGHWTRIYYELKFNYR